jgi:molybdopterin-guanine dinucleotide biosynthesis protein A
MTPKINGVDAATYAVESFLKTGRIWLPKALAEGKVYDSGMENASARDVAAFILAGGKSTRMGTDKAFVDYEGRTLLARALDLARSVTPDVRIVGSSKKFAPFAPVVEDIYRDCGPLGGIHAALRASSSELNVMLAVDTPFVSEAFLQYLISQAQSAPEAAAVVPRDGESSQPLCAIYRREFADAAESALLAGRNRIDVLFREVRTRMIEREELESAGFSLSIFRNLNTPSELEAGTRRA